MHYDMFCNYREKFAVSKSLCRIIRRKNLEGERIWLLMHDISCKRRNLFGRYYLWKSILQSPSWALIANNTGLSGKSLENSFYGPPASRKWRGNDALMYWQMFLWETNTFFWFGLLLTPPSPHPQLTLTNGHILAKKHFQLIRKGRKTTSLMCFKLCFCKKRSQMKHTKKCFLQGLEYVSPDKCKCFGLMSKWTIVIFTEHCSDVHKGLINNSYSISLKKSYALDKYISMRKHRSFCPEETKR